MIGRGAISDAKTIIALEYLALHRAGDQDLGLANPRASTMSLLPIR